MTRSDDLAPYFGGTAQDLEFHQGTVIAWSSTAGTNTIQMAGGTVTNVPAITAAGLISLRPGDHVAMLRFKSSLFIVGTVVAPGNTFVQPQWPIILYPMFQPNIAVDNGGFHNISAGKLVTWEGRLMPALPKIEVDGIWGVLTGTGNITFKLLLGGQEVGAWSYTNSFAVERKGPFDISKFIGQDWLKIEIAITASSGTGVMAFQPLGVYFRQT